MLAVLRIGGLRVVIYPNDHPPAHVHVPRTRMAGGDQSLGPKVREAINCSEREARRAPQKPPRLVRTASAVVGRVEALPVSAGKACELKRELKPETPRMVRVVGRLMRYIVHNRTRSARGHHLDDIHGAG
jgi:hypothetical protein